MPVGVSSTGEIERAGLSMEETRRIVERGRTKPKRNNVHGNEGTKMTKERGRKQEDGRIDYRRLEKEAEQEPAGEIVSQFSKAKR